MTSSTCWGDIPLVTFDILLLGGAGAPFTGEAFACAARFSGCPVALAGAASSDAQPESTAPDPSESTTAAVPVANLLASRTIVSSSPQGFDRRPSSSRRRGRADPGAQRSFCGQRGKPRP